MLAFKAVIAGQLVGASGVKNTTTGKSANSGYYTFWNDELRVQGADQVQTTDALANLPATTAQACLEACDDVGTCAGVYMEGTKTTITTCTLIEGAPTDYALKKRTLTITRVAKLGTAPDFMPGE